MPHRGRRMGIAPWSDLGETSPDPIQPRIAKLTAMLLAELTASDLPTACKAAAIGQAIAVLTDGKTALQHEEFLGVVAVAADSLRGTDDA